MERSGLGIVVPRRHDFRGEVSCRLDRAVEARHYATALLIAKSCPNSAGYIPSTRPCPSHSRIRLGPYEILSPTQGTPRPITWTNSNALGEQLGRGRVARN